MKKFGCRLFTLMLCLAGLASPSKAQSAQNPIIYADVPDLSIIRVGNNYYMSSTTMHMNPGVPIMKSTDLVNWKIVNYAYDVLDANNNALNLVDGNNAYGKGSWASCLRYHNGMYYVSTFSSTTGKTYIFSTKDIEKGPWKTISFSPSLHDHSLFFDDDGKVYIIFGTGRLMIAELNDDLNGIKPNTQKVLIENASAPAGNNINLRAEGSQLFKITGKYYLFNITWPRNGVRTVVIHRADKITGPYEGRVGLQDRGIAQGGLVSTPKGEWFAYLFRDFTAVGRIPYLVPVTWKEGWPVLGTNGKAPDTLNMLPANKSLMPGIVASDEFNEKKLPLVWQWNHNPDNAHWSLSERPGYVRITSGRVDSSVLQTRNILTQRTFGPVSAGVVAVDVSNLRDGDRAGLILLQKKFGWVGVKVEGNNKFILMVNGENAKPTEVQQLPLNQNKIYLKADCDFTNHTDKGYFYYSLDGKNWTQIGNTLQMAYTLPHFMGQRFGLFNYATKTAGGSADFDFFHISDKTNSR